MLYIYFKSLDFHQRFFIDLHVFRRTDFNGNIYIKDVKDEVL